jgi:hypothetical protein
LIKADRSTARPCTTERINSKPRAESLIAPIEQEVGEPMLIILNLREVGEAGKRKLPEQTQHQNGGFTPANPTSPPNVAHTDSNYCPSSTLMSESHPHHIGMRILWRILTPQMQAFALRSSGYGQHRAYKLATLRFAANNLITTI